MARWATDVTLLTSSDWSAPLPSVGQRGRKLWSGPLRKGATVSTLNEEAGCLLVGLNEHDGKRKCCKGAAGTDGETENRNRANKQYYSLQIQVLQLMLNRLVELHMLRNIFKNQLIIKSINRAPIPNMVLF